MTQERLAELIGVSLTRRIRQHTQSTATGVDVRVRQLAAAVAGDIIEEVNSG